jgi:mannose-6-phosphate isomerase-like protein (cupin superfamily)
MTSAGSRPHKTIDIFFYGLYMDAAVLAAKNVEPRNPRAAFVEDWALAIGRRAALVPRTGARAYGVVFALTHGEIEKLYDDLEAYRPQAVLARTLSGQAVPALCMNLPEPPAPGERNPDYAAKLREVMGKLGFPSNPADAVPSSAQTAGAFATGRVPESRSGVAPDGSAFRRLLALERASVAHFELDPGATSRAVAHRSVEEIWFFLSGRGEMWRRQGEREEIVSVGPEVWLTIPSRTRFQFRSLGGKPLRAIAVTLPPWPGDDEATVIEGPWRPSVP